MYKFEKINEDMDTQIYGMVHFEHIVRRNFPEWHYAEYDKDEIGNALSHLYFASHRSGIREILYKAGLNNLALTSVVDSTTLFQDFKA